MYRPSYAYNKKLIYFCVWIWINNQGSSTVLNYFAEIKNTTCMSNHTVMNHFPIIIMINTWTSIVFIEILKWIYAKYARFNIDDLQTVWKTWKISASMGNQALYIFYRIYTKEIQMMHRSRMYVLHISIHWNKRVWRFLLAAAFASHCKLVKK